jgi:hypothetical protein
VSGECFRGGELESKIENIVQLLIEEGDSVESRIEETQTTIEEVLREAHHWCIIE